MVLFNDPAISRSFFGGARKKSNARLGGQSGEKKVRVLFLPFSRPPTLALLYFRAPPKKETPDRKLGIV